MTKHFLVYLLIFLSTVLLCFGAYNYYSRERKTRDKINKRISAVETAEDRVLPTKRRHR
jgi:hypothetical protein